MNLWVVLYLEPVLQPGTPWGGRGRCAVLEISGGGSVFGCEVLSDGSLGAVQVVQFSCSAGSRPLASVLIPVVAFWMQQNSIL